MQKGGGRFLKLMFWEWIGEDVFILANAECFYKTDLIYYSTKTIGKENVFVYGNLTPDIRGGCAVAARQ